MVKDCDSNGQFGVQTSNIFEALSSSPKENIKTTSKKKQTMARKMNGLTLGNKSADASSTISLVSTTTLSLASTSLSKEQTKNSQHTDSKASTVDYKTELNRQKLLKNNVTIHGIPATEQENVLQLVRAVFQAIGVNVAERNIFNYYRMKGNNKIILVKLRDHETKMKILNATKKATVGDVMNCAEDQAKLPVSIDEHFTPYFGRLLAEGRRARRHGYIQSCWFDSYTCQAMCLFIGNRVAFKNIDELDKIVAEARRSAYNNKSW